MKKIECKKINETAYMEQLDNGMKVVIIPKKGTRKKYVIWATKFGSIDNHFINPEDGEEIIVPDGVAHFLEHKMFEQSNGINSLDKLTSLGIEANAYTTNEYTAYLIEASDDNFYVGLDEFMDYVQSPYYTEENVEKEKGIIGQEIKMYDDDPGFQLYLNTLKCMYVKNPIRLDIAGTIESIANINPDILYKCYNTFYHPSNMVMVLAGDFEVDKILNDIKIRMKKNTKQPSIERIYENEPEGIFQKSIEKVMSVSMPAIMIGIKDKIVSIDEMEKRQMAVDIINEIIAGNSSNLYRNLYEQELILGDIDFEYDISKNFAHVLVSCQTINPQLVVNMWISEVNRFKKCGFLVEDIERIKRKMYGNFVNIFNDVSSIGRAFLTDTLKGFNTFEFIKRYEEVDKIYIEKVFYEVFNEESMVVSIVRGEK